MAEDLHRCPSVAGGQRCVSLQPLGGVFPSDRGVAFRPAVVDVPLVWLAWKQEGLGVQELRAQGCFGAGEAPGLLQSHPGRAVLCRGGLCRAPEGCWWVVRCVSCECAAPEPQLG